MKKFINKFIQFTVGYLILWYLKKDRYYTYKGIKVLVKKGVFHPGFFLSTRFIIDTIQSFNLNQKKVLELGAGSGIISFYCASKGAHVTATDISQMAINGLMENKKQLQSNITIIESNLFDEIPNQKFDFIIINPPYYPKNPKNDSDKAWYCGENFEYFEKLFQQINTYINQQSVVLISFSEDCDIHYIESIAKKYNLKFEIFKRKRIFWEVNFIYKIIPNE